MNTAVQSLINNTNCPNIDRSRALWALGTVLMWHLSINIAAIGLVHGFVTHNTHTNRRAYLDRLGVPWWQSRLGSWAWSFERLTLESRFWNFWRRLLVCNGFVLDWWRRFFSCRVCNLLIVNWKGWIRNTQTNERTVHQCRILKTEIILQLAKTLLIIEFFKSRDFYLN